MAQTPGRRDVYSQRANRAFETALESRTAAREAAFFLSHLRPGMRVLDVGCGPGTITLGIAGVVAPGRVEGLDLQLTLLKRAQAIASEGGAENVSFSLANAYGLPFLSQTFDAVFAHAVLMFMSDPVAALIEIRRVLRPGGVVGLRDPDFGSTFLAPTTPLLQQWLDLRIRVRKHDGGDSSRGRHHRQLLLDAGFARAEAMASVSSAGSLEETRQAARFDATQFDGLARTALAERWLNQTEAEAIKGEITAWGDRPGAFSATIWCEALGWVSDSPNV